MRLVLRTVLLANAMALVVGCKTDDAAKPAPKPEPTATRATPGATTAPSTPAPDPAPPVAPAPAPPTKSELALGKRAEFFGKLSELAKRDEGDCAKLGADLTPLLDEARAIARLGAEIAAPEAAQDKAVINAGFKAMLLTTAKCADTSKIDPILDILAEVPK